MVPESGLRQIARQLALEAGKVAGDQGDVDASEDRLFGLTIEQESERRLKAALRRVSALRQSLASVAHHRHMMTALAAAFADDHPDFKRLASPVRLTSITALSIENTPSAGLLTR